MIEKKQDLSCYVALVLASILQYTLLSRLVQGNFFNSFPYISNDGYDWIYEGEYLRSLLGSSGANYLSPLFELRTPGFVIVTAVDFFLGSTGIFIIFVLSASFLFSGIYLVKILDELGIGGGLKIWATIFFSLTPFSFFRYWVLSDCVAISFMHGSLFYLLKFNADERTKSLYAAVTLTALGTWTQIYASIPMLVGGTIILWSRWRERRPIAMPALAMMTAAFVTITALLIWGRMLPHETVPDFLALLKLNFRMLNFYANTWAFYFGPFICVIAYFAFYFPIQLLTKRVGTLIVLLIFVVFAILTFFYHSAEARHSFAYYGYAIALAAIALNFAPMSRIQKVARRIAIHGSTILLLLTSFFVTPNNLWIPDMKTLKFNPRDSWLAKILTISPSDRFQLGAYCHSTSAFCEAAPKLLGTDGYPNRILQDYRSLMIHNRGAF